MRWVLLTLGALLLVVAVVTLVGALLPRSHVASVSRHYEVSAENIWQAITAVEDFPAWRSEVRAVQRLEPVDGRMRWREESKHDAITMEVLESSPNQRLVTRIADEGLPFGGSWTFELKPGVSGTDLVITENGEVYNPIFRFISKFIMGHTGTIEKYQDGLGRKLTAKL